MEFKREFSLRRVRFCDCLSEEMSSSMWFKSPIPLLVYRIILFLLPLAFIIWSISTSPMAAGHFQLAYFTVWTFITLILYFMFASISSIFRILRRRQHHPRPEVISIGDSETSNEVTFELGNSEETITNGIDCLPWYMKAHWVMYNVVTCNAILVTVIYWGILYPHMRDKYNYKTDMFDISVHGLNSVVICLEILLVAIPTRLLHFYHPLVYSLLYLLFSTIYWAVDHNNVIYVDIIDWNNPKITVLYVVGILIYFIVGQTIMYLLYKLKRFVRASCCST